ncbi:MAG: hypothetical protein LBO75_05520 [Bifidobacteriaceae bacterium]|nr:hypothetical protein [Bifidobacteriaceae bacterium]
MSSNEQTLAAISSLPGDIDQVTSYVTAAKQTIDAINSQIADAIGDTNAGQQAMAYLANAVTAIDNAASSFGASKAAVEEAINSLSSF